MRLAVRFEESDQSFRPSFQEAQGIPPGDEGYEQGYTEGFNDGHTAGYNEGYEFGKQEGYADGYNAGRSQGYTEGYEAGKADGYTAGYGEGQEAGHNAGYTEGYEVGKSDEYNAFWQSYTRYGGRTDFRYSFAGDGWTDELFNPPAVIRPTVARYMFYTSEITEITDKQVDFSPTTDMRDTFSTCDKLTKLVLKISGSKTFNNNTFLDCSALTDLTIIGTIESANVNLSWSPQLTADSLESVVASLSTSKSGLTVTLSKTAVTNAFGGTDAAEWLALIETRSNWTISLV